MGREGKGGKKKKEGGEEMRGGREGTRERKGRDTVVATSCYMSSQYFPAYMPPTTLACTHLLVSLFSVGCTVQRFDMLWVAQLP